MRTRETSRTWRTSGRRTHRNRCSGLLLLAGMLALSGCSTGAEEARPVASNESAFVESTIRSKEDLSLHAVDCGVKRTLTFRDGIAVKDVDPGVVVANSPAAVTLPTGDGAYEIRIENANTGNTENLRVQCLPEHFPVIELRGTLSSWVALTTMSTEPDRPGYRMILDSSGFPVWFRQTAGSLADFNIVDGQLITFTSGRRQVESFTNAAGKGFHLETFAGDGITRWVPTDGDGLDNHAVALLRNGNILGLHYELSDKPLETERAFPGAPQQNVDRCPEAVPGPTDRTLRGRIVEISPQGERVRSWSYEDHVNAEASSPEWINIGEPGRPECVVDIEHLNGISYYPGSGDEGRVLLTGRHVDGAVMLSWPSGEVLWRLGGTPGPDSLRIENDPEGGPLHPHDANLIDEETLLIYDNRAAGAPSRAALYRIDPVGRSATMIESYSTTCADKPCAAFAMGSSRPTMNGRGVLIGWGTESLTAAEFERGKAEPVAKLRLAETWAYRVLPVAVGDHDALFAVAKNR